MSRSALAVVALLLGSSLSCSLRTEPPPDTDPKEAAARALRQKSVAELAPRVLAAPGAGPASTAAPFPLVGPEGRDEYGYPTQYVDRAALKSLLLHRRFEELTVVVERLQAEFEGDPRKEYWPIDAADALGTGEAELQPYLDAWVKASPTSFAPYLARGTHWVARAYERRGGKWARDTPEENFSSMNAALGRAIVDLERAVWRRPMLIAAMRQELSAFLPLPFAHQWNRLIIDRALDRCPSCFQIRVKYLHTLTPRWGGSFEAMQRFLERRPDETNPRSRLLPGYLYLHLAADLHAEERYREALTATEWACGTGEHWEFLLERARARLQLDDDGPALSDLDRADQLRPGHPDVLLERAYALGRAHRWEEAARDLRAGIQANPTDSMARGIVDFVVKGLAYEGWKRHEQGDRTAALRMYDLAAELAPNDGEVQGRRAFIVAGAQRAAGGTVEVAQAVPDDFRAVQQLDYQLAREGQFERILGLWNDYLARHPDHGPAHLERGGTLFHLHRMAEARADAQKACDLGVSEGCVRARQLGAAP